MDLVEREDDLGALAGRPRPESAEKTDADLARVASAVRPYEAGHYLNVVEEKADAAGFFPPLVAMRLEAARDTYDPDRIMHANHEIGAC